MWRWDFTYPNGVQVTNELRVPAGKPVMLRMTATDVVHSFYLPDFRVKEDSMPGRVTYLWFYPRKPGEHLATCAEFCGMMHSKMIGKVIVLPPEEFTAWYDEEAKKLAQAKEKPGG
jgi:cytochrome c oxidase subunit 2